MKKLKYNKENQGLIEQGLKTHDCRPIDEDQLASFLLEKEDCEKSRQEDCQISWFDKAHSGPGWYVHSIDYPDMGCEKIECPYGAEGDRIPLYEFCVYCDTPISNPTQECCCSDVGVFAHATIESIKVKRIQDITKQEYFGEGAARYMFDDEFKGIPDSERCKDGEAYKLIFKQLWNSIYGPDAWDRNDYCWFIKFKPEVKDEENKNKNINR